VSCTNNVAEEEVGTGGSTSIDPLSFLSVNFSVSSRCRKSGHCNLLVCAQEGGGERSEDQIELVSSTIVGRRRYVCNIREAREYSL
jgi:hypothetical protein